MPAGGLALVSRALSLVIHNDRALKTRSQKVSRVNGERICTRLGNIKVRDAFITLRSVNVFPILANRLSMYNERLIPCHAMSNHHYK